MNSYPDGTVGQAYKIAFQFENGGAFWVLQSGELPPGLELTPDRSLSEMPTIMEGRVAV